MIDKENIKSYIIDTSIEIGLKGFIKIRKYYNQEIGKVKEDLTIDTIDVKKKNSIILKSYKKINYKRS